MADDDTLVPAEADALTLRVTCPCGKEAVLEAPDFKETDDDQE